MKKPTRQETERALRNIDSLLRRAGDMRNSSIVLNEVAELIQELQKAHETAEAGIMLYGKDTECPELLNPNIN